ncbi:MAG: hypothetical protein WCL57_08695 [Chloroflexota bacterium]|nr:hypothetical protein [Chloroflexota bacterium]
MNWTKLGLILPPPTNLPWMNSHAALPFAEHVTGNLFNIYFSGRDTQQRSIIGYAQIDLSNPRQSLVVHPQPILSYGSLARYDEHGAMNSWVTYHNGKKYLYYIGWNLGVSVPFQNSIGLAIADEGSMNFEKAGLGPILGRNWFDPCFVASCCVLVDGGIWRMWYLSCMKWEIVDGKPRHYYHLKYAESADGIIWRPTGKVCIDFKNAGEYAISRPSVIKEPNGLYRMWFSYRGDRYRIGYAESRDGLDWKRMDEQVGIDISDNPDDWDGKMVEYPHVFDHIGKRYMLYNGNGYGMTGAGLAIAT